MSTEFESKSYRRYNSDRFNVARSLSATANRRTIDCTPDRDSALSKWLIARAIEVNRYVLWLQTPTPEAQTR